jgi:transcription antitermination factor NusG
VFNSSLLRRLSLHPDPLPYREENMILHPAEQPQNRTATGFPWYAIRVRSNCEQTASTVLHAKGYEQFLPSYRSRRRWSDRVKELDLPLFPGYVFCRLNVRDRLLPILTTPGVVAIVGSGKTPLPIADNEIEAVRAILRSGLAAQPWPFLGVGAGVFIEAGPLAGLEGIVTNTDKVCRLVVSVSLLQRSVAVEIDRDWVRPALCGAGPGCVTLSKRSRSLMRAS